MMILAHYIQRVKEFYHENKVDFFVAALTFLVSLTSFGVARLAGILPEKTPVQLIENQEPRTKNQEMGEQTADVPVVASKNSKYYHYPWCPGAKLIKDSNKIVFDSPRSAEAAGLTLAGNCIP